MEFTSSEGRGRPKRSRKDASNKENICPSQGTDSTAAEGAHRCSPLPEGFPRSPLQDITHIIYPHNIWPATEDRLTDQVCKTFRKDNLEGSCVATESVREVAQQQCNPRWKGLPPCGHVQIGTKMVQTKGTTQQKGKLKKSANVEALSTESKLVQDLCIYRDNVLIDASSWPNCDIECGQNAKSEEQIKQMGASDAQVHVVHHGEISAEEHCANKKQSIGKRSMLSIARKEGQTKRLQQLAQSRGKSHLLMLR